MSHPLVAAVWEQLGRRDLANILHEVIGEHATTVAVHQTQDDTSDVIEHLMRSVFWIHAIFDLQRAYLQGVAHFMDCNPYFPPYLLSPHAVFSTVMYLVQVKARLFPQDATVPLQFVQYGYFLGRTLLAGVRLLLLRGLHSSPDMSASLETALRSAWNDPDMSDAEKFLVAKALPDAVHGIEMAGPWKGNFSSPSKTVSDPMEGDQPVI